MADIQNWVYNSFDEVLEYGNGTDLRVNCPFCQDRGSTPDFKQHLHISMTKQVCHCFRCEYSNGWLGLIADIEGVDFQQAHRILDAETEAIIPLYKLIMDQRIKPILSGMPKDFVTIKDAIRMGGFARALGRAAEKYVRFRLTRIGRHKYQYDELWGIWNRPSGIGKLVLPVERGWWQCRKFGNDITGPKYVSCSNPKEDRLYNYVALNKYDTILIAEGIISAACIGRDAIALCGKKATPGQLERLGKSKPHKYILCLDPDAVREAYQLAEGLARFGKVVEIRRDQHGDPADSGAFTMAGKFTPDNMAIDIVRSRLGN